MKAMHNNCIIQKAEDGDVSAMDAAATSEEVTEEGTAVTSGGSTEDYTDEILENDASNGRWRGTVWYSLLG